MKLPVFTGSWKNQGNSRKDACFIDYTKALDCLDQTNCGKFLKTEITDNFTWLLRNLYACQEATVRNGHETTDWFKIGKGIQESCILSSCFFKLDAEYIMGNVGQDESQVGM